ncbi:branched-chain amino acid transport system / permease component [Oxobacter pfennigii]|uniref:Branched-chain amino acid transport system / permease component n=1 Tax=Oxobacter pfennigii TaxID=36849 RepID=A0A0P8W768_9CLOT|nr:ABC transporter permease [Oxobacter pfennigii]KPU43638.1 branched-chain amino acid transport system / permease component [Oxobacter pfennigii]
MDYIASFFAAAIVAGTPLLFATLGEIITEKAGLTNLGVEGMMLMGAVGGFQAGLLTQNPVIAILSGALGGMIGALIFAFLTIELRVNQIVCGLALSIFGEGFASYMGKILGGKMVPQALKAYFMPYKIPLLGDIPFLGRIFFSQDPYIYLGYIIAILLGLYLYKTRPGLTLRSIGENPGAADAAGINISRYKYIHTLLGGALSGLGGAYLSLVYVPAWQEGITAGRGWIAVALVIFATWNPYKAILGSYLFGGLDIIGFRLQGTKFAVSQYLIDMLPYMVTISVLVFVSLKKSKDNSPPAALGTPYFREER